MWQLAAGGFVLGFLSSLHCVGMCGPLALALPVHHLPALKRRAGVLLYNIGRVLSYASAGFLLGLAGRQLYVAGMQQWMSVTMGAIILLVLIFNYFRHSAMQVSFINRLYKIIQQRISSVLRSPGGLYSYLWLGMLNGLLPCGMVYIALATALTLSGTLDTVLFMAMFGVGTLPAMIAVSYVGLSMNIALRRTFKKIIPYGMAFVGILLILRGLNLGIPFISPLLPTSNSDAVICHP
ncbi:MAG: sulfite exporter TauE/SafE family protein [Chitinophagaceae bacterium]|nr:sulfite exporter TauE/SafE family protein [Chitinophagaceae bacterium]